MVKRESREADISPEEAHWSLPIWQQIILLSSVPQKFLGSCNTRQS